MDLIVQHLVIFNHVASEAQMLIDIVCSLYQEVGYAEVNIRHTATANEGQDRGSGQDDLQLPRSGEGTIRSSRFDWASCRWTTMGPR